MSTFIFPENYTVMNREAGRVRKKVNRGRIRKLLIAAIGFLAALILFELIWTFFFLPNMRLQELQVISDSSFPEDPARVRAVTGLEAGIPYPDIDPQRIESLLMNNLMVEEVSVEKKFPDKVVVRLKEREPVAIGLFETKDGRTVPVLFDRDGVIIRSGSGVEHFDFPVLSGDFRFPLPVQGERLDESQIRLLTKLHRFYDESPELYKLISELHMQYRGSDNFEIVLYIRGHRVPLLMKENFTSQRLLRGIVALDTLKDVGMDKGIKLMDFRSDYVSYTYEPGDRDDD